MAASFRRHGTRYFKGHFRRIHFVIGAVHQSHLHIHDFKSGQNSRFQSLPDTFFDRGNIFLRDGASDYFVDKFKSASRRKRIQVIFT